MRAVAVLMVTSSMVRGQEPPVRVPVAAPAVSEARRAALTQLLADASVRNRLPPDLVSYKAKVETEIAVLLRREEGTETVGALEQVASTLRWTRAGQYEQHVEGDRAQQVGFSMSMLTLFQSGWVNPTLYGSRLRLRATVGGADSAPIRSRRGARRDGSGDTLPIVHPLAGDRDRYYRFSGGDTLVTIQTGARRIPIVRIRVQPRPDVTAAVALFDGDLDLDASRGTLVRLRGFFVRVGAARRHGLAVRLADAIAFVEYENSEREGKYWLPTMQRIELQASMPMLGDARAVVRIVSRFPSMAINDTTLDVATLAAADSLRIFGRRRLTYAPRDSMSAFGSWHFSPGAITSGLHSDDFNDVAPDRMRTTGSPRLELSPPRAADLFHYNRVEGAYTGLGAKLALRDVAPGVVMRANGGWAWGEKTARGRLLVERTHERWTLGVRAGRSLDLTDDFRMPADSGNTFGALFGSTDPYDYVDRRSATAFAIRRFRDRAALVRAEFGAADDHGVATTQQHGLFGGARFLPNRGVDNGRYAHSALAIEWHPEVNAEFVQPGTSAALSYDRGDGALDYQRIEGRVVTRHVLAPFTVAARADAGVLVSDHAPPQQLFELGSAQRLPDNAGKEFAGTQAAVLRTQVNYRTPFLKNPIRWRRQLWLPAIAPGLSVGVQSGWTGARTAADRASIARLGFALDSAGTPVPVARTSQRVHTTVNVGMHFFSGSVFVGVARPVDHSAGWRFLVAGGQLL